MHGHGAMCIGPPAETPCVRMSTFSLCVPPTNAARPVGPTCAAAGGRRSFTSLGDMYGGRRHLRRCPRVLSSSILSVAFNVWFLGNTLLGFNRHTSPSMLEFCRSDRTPCKSDGWYAHTRAHRVNAEYKFRYTSIGSVRKRSTVENNGSPGTRSNRGRGDFPTASYWWYGHRS